MPMTRRQRGRGKTKDVLGGTIAQRERFEILYISLPSIAKQRKA